MLPAALAVCLLVVQGSAQTIAGSSVAISELPDAPQAGVPAQNQTQAPAPTPTSPPLPPVSGSEQEAIRKKAEEQLHRQEKQRILGVVPNFNTSYNREAPPLSKGQKFRLAFRSSVDPFQFVAAGLDAAYSQAENDFPGYHQGAEGYFKRFGAAYADNFSGTILGNAVFPVLLKEDPRYFRRGTGTVKRRILYAVSTTVWAKRDSGKWGPNYANVLGNIAAGGLSNVYYPSTDRGVGLTFQRAFTVTAEGTLGALFDEFWPDIAVKVLHKSPADQ